MSINNELFHHGILGMKWGIRRYQRKDGTLTRLGKKHKASALKGLREGEQQYSDNAKRSKYAFELDKQYLKESKSSDKKNGETSWETQFLKNSYIQNGRDYINNTANAKMYSEYIKAYDNDSIKVGEDYIVKNFKTGEITLTDSGRAKESKIRDRVTSEFEKTYSKEIREYS